MKIFITILSTLSTLFALNPQEIADNVKKSSDGFGYSRSVMEMVLIDASKNKSVREIISYAKERKNGDYSMIEFKKPLDVKGTKFLTHEKVNANNDQWLYLPALKRVKRINSSNKSGSFMGSEFSYEDISSREPSKYTYSKEFKEDILDGVKVYVYERYPKDKKSGYSKQILWVDKEKFIILKSNFYDRKKELLKTGTYKWQEKIGDTFRISEIKMQNVQNQKSTILKYIDDKIHLDLDNSLFTKRMLAR